jgi:hypothetical protein
MAMTDVNDKTENGDEQPMRGGSFSWPPTYLILAGNMKLPNDRRSAAALHPCWRRRLEREVRPPGLAFATGFLVLVTQVV